MNFLLRVHANMTSALWGGKEDDVRALEDGWDCLPGL